MARQYLHVALSILKPLQRKKAMKRLIPVLLAFAFGSCQSPDLKSKTIIAHRGASGYLPEHSLPGVAMAHSWNVDFIEPDVVLTQDGVPVILHDIHIDTTTDVAKKFPNRKRKDGRYYAIDFTLKEIKTLNLTERVQLDQQKAVYPNRFPLWKSTMKVPTLVEFIELVQGLNKSRQKDIGIYPEMKSPEFHTQHGKDIAVITLGVLNQYGYTEKSSNIYLQCFHAETLKYIRFKLKSKLKLVQLIAEDSWGESSTNYKKMRTQKGIEEVAKYADGIGPWIPHIFPSTPDQKKRPKKTQLVEWAHQNGLKVHPYTARVDQLPPWANSMNELLDALFNDAKVDGIFSDFADTAMKFIGKQ